MSDVHDFTAPAAECAARRLRLVSTDPAVIAARAALHTRMTTANNDPTGCPCGTCQDHPLTTEEADGALPHVTDADALRFADGEVIVRSYVGCEGCDEWIPYFAEPAKAV